MKKIHIITAAIVLLIAACFVGLTIVDSQKAPLTPVPERGSAEIQATIHEDFPDVPASNRFVIETAEQVVDRFQNGTGIIFLGFKECPWCQKMAPIINQSAEEGGANIYYIDIRELKERDPDSYQDLLSMIVAHLPTDSNGQARVSTPDISFVRNGKIIWRYEMDPVSEAQRIPDVYWTDARKERASKDFEKYIKQIRKGE